MRTASASRSPHCLRKAFTPYSKIILGKRLYRGDRMMTGNAQSATAMSRRGFLSALTMAGAQALMLPVSNAWAQGNQGPALVTSDNMRPGIPYGVASEDVTQHSAIIWSRADRPARLIVEYA